MQQNTMLRGLGTYVSGACRLAWHLVVLLPSACSLLHRAAQTALETDLLNWRRLFLLSLGQAVWCMRPQSTWRCCLCVDWGLGVPG